MFSEYESLETEFILELAELDWNRLQKKNMKLLQDSVKTFH